MSLILKLISSCIGKNFAVLEEKVILAKILQNFNIELDPTFTPEPVPYIILRPNNGMRVKLTRRDWKMM